MLDMVTRGYQQSYLGYSAAAHLQPLDAAN